MDVITIRTQFILYTMHTISIRRTGSKYTTFLRGMRNKNINIIIL